MRTLRVIAVEVLLQDELSALIEEHAVDVLVGAIENAVYDGVGCGDAEAGVSDVSNRNAVVEIGGRMITIVRRRILSGWARMSEGGGCGSDVGG